MSIKQRLENGNGEENEYKANGRSPRVREFLAFEDRISVVDGYHGMEVRIGLI